MNQWKLIRRFQLKLSQWLTETFSLHFHLVKSFEFHILINQNDWWHGMIAYSLFIKSKENRLSGVAPEFSFTHLTHDLPQNHLAHSQHKNTQFATMRITFIKGNSHKLTLMLTCAPAPYTHLFYFPHNSWLLFYIFITLLFLIFFTQHIDSIQGRGAKSFLYDYCKQHLYAHSCRFVAIIYFNVTRLL